MLQFANYHLHKEYCVKEMRVKALVRGLVLAEHYKTTGEMLIPVTVSNRHIHLTRQHVEQLFGSGAVLTLRNELFQPGQFACEETVTIEGPRGSIGKVRVLGPERSTSQVEISMADARALGIKPPVRMSGEISDTPSIKVIGTAGEIELPAGVIVAMRHCHMTPEQAKLFGIKDGDSLTLTQTGDRPCELKGFIVRVSDKFELEAHVDVDEANACLIYNDMLLSAKIEDRANA